MERKWIYNGVEFNVGDKVRVMRQEETDAPNGMGEGVQWLNSWVGPEAGAFFSAEERGMDAYLGMEFEIEHISAEGVSFVGHCHNESYLFPLSSLDKI